MAGRKYEVPEVEEGKIVGVIEWRDGTVIDVVRAVKNKKSKYPKTGNDICITECKAGEAGQPNQINIQSLEQPIIPVEEQKELISNILSFYGLENKGITISYGDFSCEKWVLVSRFEAEIKNKLKSQIPADKLEEPFLLPEEYITEQQKEVQFDKFRLRRSNHYIPGNDPKVVAKCGDLGADCTILDLEDAVHPKNKYNARILVRNALRHLNWKNSERAIRINQGKLGLQDLEQIIPYAFVELVVCPKIETADEVRAISKKLNELQEKKGSKRPVFILPLLESAKGIENAFEIAAASKEEGVNMVGLSMGLEDYASDLGIFDRSKDDKESQWAQARVINAALSHHLQVYDSVFSDFKDNDGLTKAIEHGKQIGYTGKRTIHPNQVKLCNTFFLPNKKEITKAQAIIVALAKSKDGGVASLPSGKMIDKPVADRAQKLMKIAVEQKLVPADWLEVELKKATKK